MSKKCVNCGAELNDDDLFCGQCGTSQPKGSLHCSQCGAELQAGSKFCCQCGAPINGIAKASPAVNSKFPDCEVSQPDSSTICITIKGVTFNMKLVEGGMQDNYTELSDFYMSETVVTQELWQMIMGDNPSNDNRDLQLPVTDVNAARCNAFFMQLKKMTGCTFSFPTVFQWKYAHDGGRMATKKTKYAGSNNVDEVAWTKGNACGKIQKVAMLKPNELGLFDMDGNVKEYCKGTVEKYDRIQFNPSNDKNAGPFGISAASEENENSHFEGLRLVINVPISDSIISTKLKDEDRSTYSFEAPSVNSPLRTILIHSQKLQESRMSDEMARLQLTHTMTITAIKDVKSASKAAHSALGWKIADAGARLLTLPVEVLVSDNMDTIVQAYEIFKKANVTAEVTTKNGLGEIIRGSLAKALEQKEIEARKEAEREAKEEAERKKAESERKAKEEAERKAKEEAERKKAEEERYECSGTTRSYTDNARALPHLVERLKEKWNNKCRRGCITEGGRGVLLKNDKIFNYAGLDYIKFREALIKYEEDPNASVHEVALTDVGYRCMIYKKCSWKTEWMGLVPDGMKKRLNAYLDEGETIKSVSIAENGDWAILTDKHYVSDSTNSRIRDAMKKASSLYGKHLYVDITDRGIICCCSKGVYYENIPKNIAEIIQKWVKAKRRLQFISFTDSGTYVMADQDDMATYRM